MSLNKKTFESQFKGLVTEGATFKAHIDSRGRIVIPKKLRDALRIEKNDLLTCKISKMLCARQKKEATMCARAATE